MENLGVIFASGYTAGVICGAVSHPAEWDNEKNGKKWNFNFFLFCFVCDV